MGKRGPAPKPTRMKLVQGTFRKDRAPANEPAPEPVAPSCPSWLSREAKREWKRIVPELERLGLLTQIDRAALAAYCQAYAEWWAMERDIRAHGYVQYSAKTGFEMARPQVAMRDKALDRMRMYLQQFGLSPASRSRINVPERNTEQKPSNPFAALG